ncbi:hypothetical protein [Clostridium oryzae]|uniref:Uncharacterized protein n=1 Tax=Clostridium oryzae TaxID=1450648 RepID=A0A1V4ISQ6_9CLOT|nr:hypothetical protein [Clostridium oryzae]OPJ62929.1 hypothetical protein CLORY_15530 [Clostridium oryzae]
MTHTETKKETKKQNKKSRRSEVIHEEDMQKSKSKGENTHR